MSESTLSLLLEDDRVPKVVDEINEDIDLEIQYIMNMAEPIIELFAQAAHCSSRTLRSEMISSALTAASYIHWRLRPAKTLPWSLCGPHKEHTLRDLMSDARPSDPIAGKIFDLMQMGFATETLIEGICLLESISWSSTPTEQGHLPASKLVQRHQTYCQDTVRARAMVAALRPLLAPSAEQLKRRVLSQKLERLHRCQPNKFTGRQAYFQAVMVQAKEFKLAETHSKVKVQMRLMSKHGAKWQSLSDRAKRMHEKRAAEGASERAAKIEADKEEIRRGLRALRDQSASSASVDGPWRMTACRLSAAEVIAVNRMWDDPSYSEDRADKRREECVKDLQPPSSAVQSALQVYAPLPSAPRQRQPWLRSVVYHRSYFANAMLKLEHGGEQRLLKIIFCLQNPQLVGFLTVVEREVPQPMFRAAEYAAQLRVAWRYEYEVLCDSYTYSDDNVYLAETLVQVQPDLVFLERGRLVTDSDWKTVDDVLAALPPIPGPGS